jgi:hypothetical protein
VSLRAVTAALLTAGLLGAMTACSAGTAAPVETTSGETSALESAAAQARAAGVDEDQLAILESGAVDLEEYEAAMNRAYDCMREAGATVDARGTKSYHGVTILDATTQALDAGDAAVDDCYTRHALYVDSYWQVSSPGAVAYAERRAVALTPALRECLTGQGVDWPQDASFEELSNLAFGPDLDPASNCLERIGYPTWEG